MKISSEIFTKPILGNNDLYTYQPDGQKRTIDAVVSVNQRRENITSISKDQNDTRNFMCAVRTLHSNVLSEQFSGVESNASLAPINTIYKIAEDMPLLTGLGEKFYQKLRSDARSKNPPIDYPKNLLDEFGRIMTAEEYAARFATAIVIAAVEVGRPEAMDVFSEYLNNGENKEKALQLFTSSLITEFSTAPDPRPETSDFLTAMVARSASVRATDFEDNKRVASEFLKAHKDYIFTFEEEPIPNPLPEVEPPPVNPGPGPKSKETDKNPKKESIWDKLAEAMAGIELVIATVIASGELNREWEKRNTADGRSETNTEKFLRHAATKGLIAAVPIVAFFSYRAIKASTKDNETLDDARRAVMRTIASGAAIFGLGNAFEHFRNSNNTASPDEVGDAARKGIADYIKEAKKAAQNFGFGDLELPEGDGSTLDNVLRSIREKTESIQIGADEFDSLMTLIKMAIKAGEGLSAYGYKFAEKFDIDVTNLPEEDLKAVLGFVNETVGRLGTTAETAETAARLVKAIATGMIQARNPDLPVTTKVLQGFYQIFNAVSEPAPKRPETQEDMLKAAKKAVSKLSGLLTPEQVEVILEALEPEPQPEAGA